MVPSSRTVKVFCSAHERAELSAKHELVGGYDSLVLLGAALRHDATVSARASSP